MVEERDEYADFIAAKEPTEPFEIGPLPLSWCPNILSSRPGRTPGVTALGEKVQAALRAQREFDWLKR